MLVPKLRFKEFNNQWNKYKLEELVIFLDGQRKPIKDSDRNKFRGVYPYYGASGIIDYVKDYIFDKDTILLGEDGANILTRSTRLAFIASGKYWVNNHAHVLEPKNTNIFFLCELLESLNYEQYNTGTAQPKLNQEVCKNIELTVPDIMEQSKIGNFLSLVNKKIELQQRKIEALKIYKKGLIQKLKYRSQNWNEYKIKNLFEITRGQVIPKNNLKITPNEEYKYPVYSSQTSNYGILGYDKTYDFDGQFLTWTTDGANAGKVFYRNGKFRCTNVCGLLYSPKNSPYINLLTADLLNYETPKHVSYVGNPKLMNNVMADIKIKLPSLEIQNHISNILSALNNKLFIEENKVKNLNTLKKSLLQQMFI